MANNGARYYTPTDHIEMVPGVTKIVGEYSSDTYAGTAEALQQSGLLRLEMLPAPGATSISWRPEGSKRKPGGSWCFMPGYMTIHRDYKRSGFRVDLAVSAEEQERRRIQRREREARQRDAIEKRRNIAIPAQRKSHLTLVWSAP